MRRILLFAFITLAVTAICVMACRPNQRITAVVPNDVIGSDYPTAIANIFINKCAIAGCHDAASGVNADGLVMDTWEHLFNGGNDGAMVVPYCSTFSPLLYYVNTNIAIGDTARPLMPISTTTFPQKPLTQAEYDTIRNWIARGAPDKFGDMAFSANLSTRQKIYLTQSGCNQLAVIDAYTKLVMRYIPVGDSSDAAQHDVTVSSDGAYAYVSFFAGNIIQKIDCTKDTVVSTLRLVGALPVVDTGGEWSIITISPDNSTLLVSSFLSQGYIIAVNTSVNSPQMSVNTSLSLGYGQGGTNGLYTPHGLAANASFDTFYATLEYGNEVMKWWFESGSPHFKTITIKNMNGVQVHASGLGTPDPHQIIMSPDYSKYFVTCENTNEVRVLSTANDQLIDSIPVGGYPQEMAFDTVNHHLFVVCMFDYTNFSQGWLGSVAVIDYNTDDLVTTIRGDFFEPHDAAVDYQDNLLFITSTNLDTIPGQPKAHHTTLCGVPGWYCVYDLNNLTKPIVNQYFVLTDPYAIANRF